MKRPPGALQTGPRPEREPDELLSSVARELESLDARLLRVVRRGGKPVKSVDRLVAELRSLLQDLQYSYLALSKLLDRRDLRFSQEAQARRLLRHHVWLYRKIHLEQFFLHKLQLEAKLRVMVSAEAFDLYQELQGLEHLERTFARRTDEQVSRALEEGEPPDLWIRGWAPAGPEPGPTEAPL